MLLNIQSGTLTLKGRNATITRITNMIMDEDLELMNELELELLLAIIPEKKQ